MSHLIIPEAISFIQAESALFISNPQWIKPPYKISEDIRFVAGLSFLKTKYVPLPWNIFFEGWENIGKVDGVEVDSKLLAEDIDRDNSSLPYRDCKFYLVGDLLIRYRNDRGGKENAHTCMMRGLKSNISKLCKEIGYPCPYNKENFPYKSDFEKNFDGEDFLILDIK